MTVTASLAGRLRGRRGRAWPGHGHGDRDLKNKHSTHTGTVTVLHRDYPGPPPHTHTNSRCVIGTAVCVLVVYFQDTGPLTGLLQRAPR